MFVFDTDVIQRYGNRKEGIARMSELEMTQAGDFPSSYQRDIQLAVKILKDAGCSDVFLFGSVASAQFREGSDLDLAVRGCPPKNFFHVWGQLLLALEHSVDLINLDRADAFARYLQEHGQLVPIG